MSALRRWTFRRCSSSSTRTPSGSSRTNRERPFFVELALSAPHLPEYPFGEFKGTSQAGPYGDVVMEIDSIVGRLLDKLRELELDRDTMVFFTSDNGPWYEGSSAPLRDRKGGMAYDGGFRVPFLAWAPGLIPAGTTDGRDHLGHGPAADVLLAGREGLACWRRDRRARYHRRADEGQSLRRTKRSCCSTTSGWSACGRSGGST